MTLSKPVVIGAILFLCVGGFILFGNNGASELPEGLAFGNGRIEAVQVDISSKIPGRVHAVLANEGDLVQAGQTVATIDAAQLRASLLRAQAEIASAKSQVAAARASVTQMKAQLTLAETEFQRAAKLVKNQHISQARFDTVQSQHEVSKATLASAEALLVSRRRSVDAAIAVAQEIETQIEDCILVSPTIGRVLYRFVEPREVLGAGGKVMTLINLTDVYMEIFLPTSQAHRVTIGSEARIKLDILDFAIPATVTFVSPESQFTPKQVETAVERDKLMFRVKVRVPPELVRKHIDRVKTGVRGVAYVRLDGGEQPDWPDFLQKLPSGSPQAVSLN